MYTGKIVEESGVDEIFADPKHPYTQGLLEIGTEASRDGEAKTQRLQTIDGTVPSPTDLPAGCHFAAAVPISDGYMCTRGEIPLTEAPDGSRVRCVLYDQSTQIRDRRANGQFIFGGQLRMTSTS